MADGELAITGLSYFAGTTTSSALMKSEEGASTPDMGLGIRIYRSYQSSDRCSLTSLR